MISAPNFFNSDFNGLRVAKIRRKCRSWPETDLFIFTLQFAIILPSIFYIHLYFVLNISICLTFIFFCLRILRAQFRCRNLASNVRPTALCDIAPPEARFTPERRSLPPREPGPFSCRGRPPTRTMSPATSATGHKTSARKPAAFPPPLPECQKTTLNPLKTTPPDLSRPTPAPQSPARNPSPRTAPDRPSARRRRCNAPAA